MKAAACLIAAIFSAQSPTPLSAQSQKVDFAQDVQPIFRQYCYGCHGPTQQMNGFRLDRRRDAMRGGTIAMIGPGNSEGSRLYHRLIGSAFGTQMPPTGALKPEQVAIIKAWIDQGAQWPDELSGEVAPTQADARATRLMDALRGGNLRAFRSAASDRDAVVAKGVGGTTPLMYAVLYGDPAAVRFLLDRGADPNAPNDAGATALMWAVGDLEKTRLLLERDADVNARSADGRTPLLIASGLHGAAPVIRLLLDRGASTAATSAGIFGPTTPLTEAAYSGDEAVFRLLVERGADLKAAGPVALALSLRSQCRFCADTLITALDKDAFTIAMLVASPPAGPSLATEMLLDLGADPRITDADGRTMLMLAAASDAAPVGAVKALLARGLDLDATSKRGDTALGLARLRGNTPVVDVLTKAGAREAPLPAGPAGSPAPAASVRAAIERSLPLLQKSDVSFFKKAGCVSCHNNTITAMVVAAAREKKLAVDEPIARGQLRTIATYVDGWRDRALQGIGIPGDADTVSYILLGLAAEKHPADAATDAQAYLLKRQQVPDGRWRILAHRPPIESSDIQVTAASMRALQLYAPAAMRASYQQAVRRAVDWLTKQAPVTTEERAFHLLGLGWGGASRTLIQQAARALIAEQRADGGWAQTPLLSSDAYATGQALVALAESGAVRATDPAFVRGVQYLLRTQYADGSWYVRTRAIPLQPHFESDFPYGRDQFISAAGTNWAVRALLFAYTPGS
jgi:ankyrin repeat protein/mono/diheme cytochrome c family protein